MEYMNKRIEERIVGINNEIKEIDKEIGKIDEEIASIDTSIAMLRGDNEVNNLETMNIIGNLENNKVDEIRLKDKKQQEKDEKKQEIEHLSAIKNNKMTPQEIIEEMKNMIAKAKDIDMQLKKLIEVKKTSEKDKESYEQLYKEMSELYKQISVYEFDLLKYCLIPSKMPILEEMIEKLEEQEQQYSKEVQELLKQYEEHLIDSKQYSDKYNVLRSLFRSKLNRFHNLKKLSMYAEGVLRFGQDMWKFEEGSEEYRKYEGCKSITYLMNQLLLFDNEKKIEQIKQVTQSKRKTSVEMKKNILNNVNNKEVMQLLLGNRKDLSGRYLIYLLQQYNKYEITIDAEVVKMLVDAYIDNKIEKYRDYKIQNIDRIQEIDKIKSLLLANMYYNKNEFKSYTSVFKCLEDKKIKLLTEKDPKDKNRTEIHKLFLDENVNLDLTLRYFYEVVEVVEAIKGEILFEQDGDGNTIFDLYMKTIDIRNNAVLIGNNLYADDYKLYNFWIKYKDQLKDKINEEKTGILKEYLHNIIRKTINYKDGKIGKEKINFIKAIAEIAPEVLTEKINGRTPLACCINAIIENKANGSDDLLELIKSLIDKDKSVLLTMDEDKKTPLCLYLNAISCRKAKFNEKIIDELIDTNREVLLKQGEYGQTPLHLYLECEKKEFDAKIIDELIDTNREVLLKQEAYGGQTPLHLYLRAFVYNRDIDFDVNIMKNLIDANKEVLLKQDKGGKTPLHVYLKYGEKEFDAKIIDELIDTNREVLLKQGEYGQTPLHIYLEYEKKEFDAKIIDELIDTNREVILKQDEDGQTPLHIYLKYGEKEFDAKIIDELIDTNREVLLKQGEYGQTPLHLYLQAVEWGKAMFNDKIMIKLISDDKKVLSKQGYYGQTPLHIYLEAVKDGKAELKGSIVEMLIDNNKEVLSKQDKDGKTPLHLIGKLIDTKQKVFLQQTQDNSNFK